MEGRAFVYVPGRTCSSPPPTTDSPGNDEQNGATDPQPPARPPAGDDAPAADSRARLDAAPDAVVRLGLSAEGLPLLLSVRRSVDLRAAVASSLGLPGHSLLPDTIGAPFAALNRAVHRHCCTVGITALDSHRTYVTSKQVSELVGQPMLAALLGADSPIKSKQSRATAPYGSLRAKPLVTSVEFLGGVDRGGYNAGEVSRQLGGAVHFGVPLEEDRSASVVRVAKDESPSVRKIAEWEDLRSLCGSTWRCPEADTRGRQLPRILSGRVAEDHEQLVRALGALTTPTVTYCVTRQSVGEAIAQLGRSLSMLHRVGEVHGDVCPVNTLLLPGGAKMIDALRIRSGTIAFAGTPGWCAPEQALYKPVTPAADVYPLGLMLVKLLNACIYGEERKYILPTSQDTSKRVRLLPSPSVLIDAKRSDINNEASRAAWKIFIERCVAFEANDRPQGGDAFAQELEALLAEHALPGSIENAYKPPGELVQVAVVAGNAGPARVLTDVYTSMKSCFD